MQHNDENTSPEHDFKEAKKFGICSALFCTAAYGAYKAGLPILADVLISYGAIDTFARAAKKGYSGYKKLGQSNSNEPFPAHTTGRQSRASGMAPNEITNTVNTQTDDAFLRQIEERNTFPRMQSSDPNTGQPPIIRSSF